MAGWVGSIERATENNTFFRRVVSTGRKMQLVVMSLRPGEEIGAEVHPSTDQFFRVEEGRATLYVDGDRYSLRAGDAALVPAGTRHNVVNASRTQVLKLYTLYAPPEHPLGTRTRRPPSRSSRRRS